MYLGTYLIMKRCTSIRSLAFCIIFGISIQQCVSKSAFSFITDYSEEANKILRIDQIKQPTSNEMRLAKKVVFERNNVLKERARVEKYIKNETALRGEMEEAIKLAEKACVFAYLRSLLEVYEWLLDNNEGKSRKVTDDELEKLGLPIDLTDHTVKNSLRSHYGKWLRILENDADPRIAQFKLQIIPELGFKKNEDFAKYAAFLFCMLSNIGHNFPSDLINFGNEEKVIRALKGWNIEDPMVLNTARAFYRLVRLPSMSSTENRALIAYSPMISALKNH